MVAASRAFTEKARFVGPESWSRKKARYDPRSVLRIFLQYNCSITTLHYARYEQVSVWVETLHGGMYAKLAEYFVHSGKQLHIMWKGDVNKRVIAAGGSQANADDIYVTFHGLVRAAKKKRRAALGKKDAGGVHRSDDVAIEIVEGPKDQSRATMMYGGGLSTECVENLSKNLNTE